MGSDGPERYNEVMHFPNDTVILSLHQKYAPNKQAFRIVYGHCQIIDEIAKQLIEKQQLNVDPRLVHAAALLHDIGYYPLLDGSGHEPKGLGIKHGVIGAEILRKERVPEAICRIAERHTGVGLTRKSILQQNLPLPPRDLTAETPEEWLVMYADKLHTKSILADDPHDTIGWFVSPKTYLAHAQKFGEDNAARFTQLVEAYGVPDLKALSDTYNQQLR